MLQVRQAECLLVRRRSWSFRLNGSKNSTLCLDVEKFDALCENFSSELVKALDVLPGPKHPATKYFQRRKEGRPNIRGKGYKDNSNPEKSRKERVQSARERYEFELTQFEYYNRRRKAWQRVRKSNSNKPCRIPKGIVEEHFRTLLSTPNDAVRESYEAPCPAPSSSSVAFSETEIQDVMKGIDPGTAPGVDRVLLRPVKVLKCAKVIAVIASIMMKFGYVPQLYREGHTVLVHKGGDEKDIGNFRPITIFPIVRRIIERAIDRRVRKTVSFCTAQRGFVSTPGTYVNSSILNTVLQSAKKNKRDVVAVFLDVRKAFDNVGHLHLASVVDAPPLADDVKTLLVQLMTQNTIQIEVNRQKTSRIRVSRGVPQGAPLSPTLFNLAIDFLVKELIEKEIAETYGYEVSEVAGVISCIAFADDFVIVAKDWESATILVDLVIKAFREIGLEVNYRKSKVVDIRKGQLHPTSEDSTDALSDSEIASIPKLQHGERVSYLGNSFTDEITLDKRAVLQNLTASLNELVGSPLLKPDQKLNIINQFIWPTLVYPLQCAPLKQLSSDFLKDVDIAIRGAVKEILQIPMDTPDAMIYSPRKFRGLGIVRASWEAFLQHINICTKLSNLHDAFLDVTRDFVSEIQDCLSKLDIPPAAAADQPRAQNLRKDLRLRAYETWCGMPVKGQGAIQFQQYPPANKWIIDKEGLSSSQWTNAIKMTTNCAAVRGIKGRCGETSSCRHSVFCKKNETLSHVLQDCAHGELLRVTRHHTIRDILHEKLQEQGFTVYSEVRCVDNVGRERRADLVVIDRLGLVNGTGVSRPQGYILDPTVRFETTADQALEVDAEKREIYEPTIPHFQASYGVREWEVIGLYVGARGTITSFLVETLRRFRLPKSIFRELSTVALRHSLGILHHHLYKKSR